MGALMWYGLTGQEAARLCEEKGLRADFAVTMDPKAAAADAAAADVTVDGAAAAASPARVRCADTPRANIHGVPRVIRATETERGMAFLLGFFAAGIEEQA